MSETILNHTVLPIAPVPRDEQWQQQHHLVVTGGREQGVRARAEDLQLRAVILDSLADDLQKVALWVRRSAGMVGFLHRAAPDLAVTAHEAVQAISGVHGPDAMSASFRSQAQGLRFSAWMYLTAEERVAAMFTGGQFVSGLLLAVPGARLLRKLLPVSAASKFLQQHGLFAPHPQPAQTFMSVLTRAAPGSTQHDFALFNRAFRKYTGAATEKPVHSVLVQSPGVQPRQNVMPARTAGQSLQVVPGLADRSAQAGHISISRVVSDKGVGRWVVVIPGTKSWWPVRGSHPFDLTSNVQLMGKEGLTPTEKTILSSVRKSMHSEGVRPGSEEVMLVGYSQGGIMAAHMARHSDVQEMFNITRVVSAGAPTDHTSPLPGVRELSVQHRHDQVPQLDGRVPAEEPRRVTVTVDEPVVNGEKLSSHDAHAYGLSVDGLRESVHPEILRWNIETAGFHEGEQREYLYELRR